MGKQVTTSSKGTSAQRSRGLFFRKTSIQTDVSTRVSGEPHEAAAAYPLACRRDSRSKVPSRRASRSDEPCVAARTPRAPDPRFWSRFSHLTTESLLRAGPHEAQDLCV